MGGDLEALPTAMRCLRPATADMGVSRCQKRVSGPLLDRIACNADRVGEEEIGSQHVAEAIQYRQRARG